jgi:hypothetical protein
MKSILDRRRFLQLASAGAAFLAKKAHPQVAPVPRVGRGQTKTRKNVVAIQVRCFGWVDEGVDAVLDNIQNKGNVNTVWAYTFGYGETRLKKGGSLPDHGISGDSVTGGAFYDYDQKYFQNTMIKEFRSAQYGKFNVIEEVAAKAKARGMDFFAWDLNNSGPILDVLIPNYAQVTEVDMYGRRTTGACFNHPDYQAFLYGKVESLLGGYSSLVDGVAWGSERTGPFENMLGRGGIVTCFCQFCQAKAREQGINVARAQTGYREMVKLMQAAGKDQRPVDGYFTVFWRLLLKYPEILAWENLWTESFQEVQADLYGVAKAIAPQKPFGFHIMQSMTFSPFYRAEEDYAQRRNYADFLKIATYNNAGGPRLAAYLQRLGETIFHDMSPSDFLPFYYKIMNYNEAPFDQLGNAGLSPDYVAKETKRAVDGVAGEVKIWPGIDIDVPVLGEGPKATDKRTNPEDVSKAIRAAFGAGADGVVLSREYVEMWLANLTSAGDTLRDLFSHSAK